MLCLTNGARIYLVMSLKFQAALSWFLVIINISATVKHKSIELFHMYIKNTGIHSDLMVYPIPKYCSVIFFCTKYLWKIQALRKFHISISYIATSYVKQCSCNIQPSSQVLLLHKVPCTIFQILNYHVEFQERNISGWQEYTVE